MWFCFLDITPIPHADACKSHKQTNGINGLLEVELHPHHICTVLKPDQQVNTRYYLYSSFILSDHLILGKHCPVWGINDKLQWWLHEWSFITFSIILFISPHLFKHQWRWIFYEVIHSSYRDFGILFFKFIAHCFSQYSECQNCGQCNIVSSFGHKRRLFGANSG